MVKKVT